MENRPSPSASWEGGRMEHFTSFRKTCIDCFKTLWLTLLFEYKYLPTFLFLFLICIGIGNYCKSINNMHQSFRIGYCILVH